MDSRKEEQHGGAVGWMTVPTFGDWDMKNGPVPDYSMDFSKIREMRKQNKRELSRASLGGDDDLLAQQHKAAQAQAAKAAEFAPAADDHHRPLHTAHDDSPTGRKKFLSYFQCCIRA
ncbi:uncharacterized protein [Lolium perenne]|uniref:uncharacterized protein n=1 Tax=Lolium perenne TaxID=4522 RepID=UPI0021F5F28D|nr:uncharacterized protein LOC127293003 [Lolium perenne]